jgi:hypothetical protein
LKSTFLASFPSSDPRSHGLGSQVYLSPPFPLSVLAFLLADFTLVHTYHIQKKTTPTLTLLSPSAFCTFSQYPSRCSSNTHDSQCGFGENPHQGLSVSSLPGSALKPLPGQRCISRRLKAQRSVCWLECVGPLPLLSPSLCPTRRSSRFFVVFTARERKDRGSTNHTSCLVHSDYFDAGIGSLPSSA